MPGCDWTHQVSSGYLQYYSKGGSDTISDVVNVSGGEIERFLLTPEALGSASGVICQAFQLFQFLH